MLEKIGEKMVEYYRGDIRRINHFMKVHGYAALIGRLEGLDERTQETLEAAAFLHDIGIKISEAKYHSSAGRYQEKEGPEAARELLKDICPDEEMTDRICYLIGHHHTYTDIKGMDYQILVEADFLVNLDEDGMDRDAVKSVREKIFVTESGKRLMDRMFL